MKLEFRIDNAADVLDAIRILAHFAEGMNPELRALAILGVPGDEGGDAAYAAR